MATIKEITDCLDKVGIYDMPRIFWRLGVMTKGEGKIYNDKKLLGYYFKVEDLSMDQKVAIEAAWRGSRVAWGHIRSQYAPELVSATCFLYR